MRILNSVLGDATGGRWQVVCDYNRLLSRHGHTVLLLLNEKHLPDLSQLPEGSRVETLSSRGHYDYLASWSARTRLREFSPDLAIAHCSRSVALLKRALRGIAPVVAVSHSNKVKRLLGADAYLALTRHIQQQIEQQRPVGVPRPCFVVPNMLPIDDAGQLVRRRLNQPPRIGALGRLDVVKGFDVFIEALALLRSRSVAFEATLGGAGAERRQLKAQAQRLGLGALLEFRGWVEQVDGFLSDIDMLCVPARSDAFGLTPLEAAAAGVPLVLSRAAGHREMFEDEKEALFCDVDDPASTARQLERLVADPQLGERLRHAAFERTKRCYSESAVSDKLLQALEIIAETCKR